MRLSPLGTLATFWPFVPALDMDDECGTVGGMTGRGNLPVPLCPLQIKHDLTWVQTQATAVVSQ
jgi:hypothetical protein